MNNAGEETPGITRRPDAAPAEHPQMISTKSTGGSVEGRSANVT